MRRAWAAGLIAAAAALGCQTDKHNTSAPLVEEFNRPPPEARFDNPPEKMWKARPKEKEFKPGMGAGGGGAPGGGMGGRGF